MTLHLSKEEATAYIQKGMTIYSQSEHLLKRYFSILNPASFKF